MAVFGAGTVGVYTDGYISPLTYLNKRDIRRAIFPRYREENLFDFLYHSGRKKITDNTRFDWWEHDYLFKTAEVASNSGTNGAGNSVQVTLSVGSHTESGTRSAGKVGDLVLLSTAAGVFKGFVSAVDKTTPDAHIYTIAPQKATDNIVGNTAAESKIAFYSHAKADGTGMPDSETRKPLQFTNYTQITATQYETYGSVAANKSEVDVKGKPYYYLQGVEDAANKQNIRMEFSWIFNEQNTALTDPGGNGEIVNISRGLESYVENFGNLQPYSTFQYSTLTTIEKTLDGERAPDLLMILNGVNLGIDIDGVVKGELDNNGTMYEMFGTGDRAKRYVDFGFDGFRFNSRRYLKKKWNALNYTPVSGSGLNITGTDSPYPDMGFLIPLDKMKSPKGGEYYDTMSIRYKANDRGSRFMKHWVRDVTITNNDAIEFNHMAEAGLQLACLNQFIKIYKS